MTTRARHIEKTLAAFLLVAAALLTGCAVGPDYDHTAAPMPDAWHETAVAGLQDQSADLHAWWLAFDDPTLNALIDRATVQNNDLAIAYWRIVEARALRGIADGENAPRLDATGSFTQAESSDRGIMPIGEYNLHSTGIDATWEVDVFGRIRRNIESADASLQAAVEDRRDLMVVLYSEVAATYVEIRTLQARIASAEDNVVSQTQAMKLAEDRFDAELVPELDVAQARRNLATTQSIVPSLQQQLIAQKHSLAVLLGQHPGSLEAELEPIGHIPPPPQSVAVGLPVELLRQRPDIRAAERRVAAQHAQIGVATADLYPRFSLTGTFALESTTFSGMFEGNARAWSWGPAVRWNIFDGNRIRSNIAAQDARTRQLTRQYEQQVLIALAEVESAMAAYGQEQLRTAALDTAAAAAQQSVDLVDTLYRNGLTDFQNVLEAQRSQFELQDQLITSRGRVTQSLIGLYRALGGGWAANTTPTEPSG